MGKHGASAVCSRLEQVPKVQEIAINDAFILEAHVFKVRFVGLKVCSAAGDVVDRSRGRLIGCEDGGDQVLLALRGRVMIWLFRSALGVGGKGILLLLPSRPDSSTCIVMLPRAMVGVVILGKRWSMEHDLRGIWHHGSGRKHVPHESLVAFEDILVNETECAARTGSVGKHSRCASPPTKG